MTAADPARPLRGLRVLTLVDDRLPSLGKAFVDLGADVEVVPSVAALSLRPLLALLETRGKRVSHRTAPLDSRLGQADVLVCTPGRDGVDDLDALQRAYPHLVIAAITDFGLTGERRHWTGTEAVFQALAGTLARSGEPGGAPLLPPGELFTRGAAQQIAWGVLVALAGRERRGAVLDCSLFECGLVCLDPAFGMTGSGTPDTRLSRGRTDVGAVYPIFKVQDGFVRVAVLSAGQWESLLAWMGHPPALAGEELLTNPGRYANADLVVPAMAAFFSGLTSAELVRECRARHLPASAVLSVSDVLQEEHYREVGLLATLGHLDGKDVVTAEGMVRIDGVRTVPRPAPGPDPGWELPVRPLGAEGPLSGLTVLDLGVIVAGPQAGLLFAEQGARVIRVENRQFPDGMRRSFEELTPALARGHLGKESLGLDLRSDEGREIFTELVRRSDIVISNFKPGTMERLGLGYDDLVTVNDAIVCVESSAFGDTGPWRTAMGYGPLVRAGSGLTWLWRHDDDATYFADGITIYPDHLAGRVCATAVLACVLHRRRSGDGAHVTVAQSDVGLVQLAELLAAESVSPGSVHPPGRLGAGPLDDVVLPAAGDDEWCVVDPRTPEQVVALRGLLRLGEQDELRAALVAYLDRHGPAAAARLQAAGVPAAPMLRAHELGDDAALQARGMYFPTPVAGTEQQVLVERYPVLTDGAAAARPGPAPAFGQHTRSILAELGLSGQDVERLFALGVAQCAEALRHVDHLAGSR